MSFVARVSRPSCEKKPSLRIAGNVAIPFCPRAGAREGRGESSGGGRGAGKRGGARVIYFFHDLDIRRYPLWPMRRQYARYLGHFRPTRKKGGKRIRRGALSKPIRRPQDGTQRTSSAKTWLRVWVMRLTMRRAGRAAHAFMWSKCPMCAPSGAPAAFIAAGIRPEISNSSANAEKLGAGAAAA